MSRLGFAISVTAVAATLVSACGGVSENNGAMFNDAGSSGSAGSGTAQGGDDDGSAAGKGGSATQGGQGNTAGSGMPTAGTSPMEGGAPGLSMPDPTVKEGCKDYCAGIVAADCDGTTQADCVLGCRAISGSATCNGKFKDLLECSKGKAFTCNRDGDAVPEGCEAQYAQAGLCLLSNPDQSLAEPCKAYCDAAEAAACANTTPSGECSFGCQLASNLVSQCAADWKKFVDCAATADVTCNDSGDPSPNACAAQYLTWLACYATAAQ